MNFDWVSLLIGLATASILFNLGQVASAYIRRNRAKEDLKKAEAELRKIKKEIESNAEILKRGLLKDLKGDGK